MSHHCTSRTDGILQGRAERIDRRRTQPCTSIETRVLGQPYHLTLSPSAEILTAPNCLSTIFPTRKIQQLGQITTSLKIASRSHVSPGPRKSENQVGGKAENGQHDSRIAAVGVFVFRPAKVSNNDWLLQQSTL